MPTSDRPAEIRVAAVADLAWVERVHDGCDALWTQRPDVPERDRIMFEAAVIELATNVVRHATRADGEPVRAELVLRCADAGLSAELRDTGAAMRVDLDPEPVDDFAESGRGIRLILRAVDSLSLGREQGQNVWRITRAWGD
ncbi:ATP-binding protein [Cellulomonas taurus]|uniref:ATP-binding protein n=1 Tax=Cellulomonas taurus TaxID=2729175 RepID=UPI00145F9B3A|nr:ATP-binding protein [Cellulomonas taurus]